MTSLGREEIEANTVCHVSLHKICGAAGKQNRGVASLTVDTDEAPEKDDEASELW